MKQLQNKTFYFYLISSIFWFILIVYLLIFYNSKSIDVPLNSFDKIIHFILFFIQSYLITRTYFSIYHYNKSLKRIIIFLFIISCSLEILQIYISYRTFDFYDLFANIFGTLFGSIFAYFLVSK